jgi:hypothetical protein
MTQSRARVALFGCAALSAAWLAPAAARAIDWAAADAERVVEIVTRDEDGAPRETKIWLVVVDGEGYIRTGGTRWWGNVERDPDVLLRVAGAEHPLRAALVTDEALLARVVASFRTKYGFSDRMAGLVRFGDTHVMRLERR